MSSIVEDARLPELLGVKRSYRCLLVIGVIGLWILTQSNGAPA